MARLCIVVLLLICCGCRKEVQSPQKGVQRTDGNGRTVTVSASPQRIICSGAGALRLVAYLNALDRVVGVESMEKDKVLFKGRPYYLANRELFATLPTIGDAGPGKVANPELIALLEPQPDVIIKTYASMGNNPDELSTKTRIPVFTVEYGNLTTQRETLFQSLSLLGELLGKEERADSVIAFFKGEIAALHRRTVAAPPSAQRDVYIGGIAYCGHRGVLSTDYCYAPFLFTNTPHVAAHHGDTPKGLAGNTHGDIGQEQLLKWNPEVLFIDLSTTNNPLCNGLQQLRTTAAYAGLPAVEAGEIYGLLPHNYYTTNYGSVLANCWYVGKTLYPEQFSDINVSQKADAIFSFLVGKPVFDQLNGTVDDNAFTKLQ